MKLLKLFLLLYSLFSSSKYSDAQIITTFAGGGATLGDGGPAINASLSLPVSGSFDAAGNYYFWQNVTAPRVRKVTPAGIITTVAGTGIPGFSGDNGPATSANIHPQGMAVDSVGNIYLADYYNNRVRKVDASTGIIHTIAGNGTASISGDGGPATAATTVPIDVEVDNAGNIYISDNGTNIRKINSLGIISTLLVAPTTIGLGMCFDATGHLYIGAITRILKVDTSNSVVDTLAGTSSVTYNGDEIAADTANFRVFDIVIDKDGSLYIADIVSERIRKIDASGIIHTVTGTGVAGYSGDNGPAASAEIYNPEGVAVDTCGNLYIADEQNNRIRKVTFHPNCFPESVKNVNKDNEINIYPNPAKEQLRVTGGNDVKEVMILNTIGQVLIAQKNYSNKAVIDVSALSRGIYFIKVSGKNGVEKVRRFLKE